MSFLVFGSTGWIGGQMVELLRSQGETVNVSSTRLQNRESVERELDTFEPKYVLNCAGVTGRPNVDWCEDHRPETIRANVIGTLNLADCCFERGIHMTNFATGCIFEYDAEHPIGGKGFLETDKPNFAASFYSHTKGMVENLMSNYPNVLTLRVRMPISDDLSPRNFITKISKYAKVVNVPNSMTVLTDLLPLSMVLARKGCTGVYNFTNPGAISHNEILDLYKKYIDPEFKYTNFTLEEQAAILKAGRSNNTLDSAKFEAAVAPIKVPEIHESMVQVFIRMRKNLGLADGQYYKSPAKI
jgi:dTDP-4-dehydrorhamnose reductase